MYVHEDICVHKHIRGYENTYILYKRTNTSLHVVLYWVNTSMIINVQVHSQCVNTYMSINTNVHIYVHTCML